MRRALPLLVLLVLVSCGLSGSPTDAEKLAKLDHASSAAPYNAAIDNLVPKCTQDRHRIAALGYAGKTVLANDGHPQFSALDSLRGMDKSTPPGVGPIDCQSVLATWETLIEQ